MAAHWGLLLLDNKSHSALCVTAQWTPPACCTSVHSSCPEEDLPSSWSPITHPLHSIPEHSAVEVWIPFEGTFLLAGIYYKYVHPHCTSSGCSWRAEAVGGTPIWSEVPCTIGCLLGCVTHVAYQFINCMHMEVKSNPPYHWVMWAFSIHFPEE